VIVDPVEAVLVPDVPPSITLSLQVTAVDERVQDVEHLSLAYINIRMVGDFGSPPTVEVFGDVDHLLLAFATGSEYTPFGGNYGGDPLRERISVYVDDGTLSVTPEAHDALQRRVFAHVFEDVITELAVGEAGTLLVIALDGFTGVGTPLLDEPVPVVG
jgi:hypothetical protein